MQISDRPELRLFPDGVEEDNSVPNRIPVPRRIWNVRGLVKPVLLIALAVSLCSLFLCRQVLGLIPHVSDEISYVFQGRILASGRLWLNPPPVPKSLAIDRILITHDRWCSVYPAGWPLLLAAGWLFHAPWLMNPLLLFLSVLGIYRLALQLFDRQIAALAALLFSISPFVLFMSAGFMSHPATLCFSIWSAVFLTQDGKRSMLLIAGLLAGYAFLIRPFTAMTLLAPLFLWTVLRGENKITTAFWLLVGLLPAVLCFLVYNHIVFGNWIEAGYPLDPLWEYKGPETSEFFTKLLWYFRKLNRSIWGLPFGDLSLLLPLIFYRVYGQKILMLLSCCITLVVGYSFYYWTDIVYGGPRFAYETLGFLSILSAVSIISVARALRKQTYWIRIAGAIAGLALVVCPLAILLPVEYGYHSQIYHGQCAVFLKRINEQGVGENALFLLKSNNYFILGSFYFNNDLFPTRGRRVFVNDVPGRTNQLLRTYPRSETWSVEIEIDPLPGRNSYTDRWRLRKLICTRADRN
jgi:hypothetical protein